MNIFLRGDRAVPMIIAKRFVSREPKINKTRKFVGCKQGLGTLVYMAIELVQECFWDEEQEIEDEGESRVINYAIDIMDTPGQSAPELVVTKLEGESHPGCGIYCHVISPIRPDGMEDDGVLRTHAPTQEESVARMVQPKKRRPGSEEPLPPPERL